MLGFNIIHVGKRAPEKRIDAHSVDGFASAVKHYLISKYGMECQNESCYVCQRQPRSWCVNRLLPVNHLVHIPPFIDTLFLTAHLVHCPACRTYLIATRFWVIIKCLTVLEFSFILFDLCLFIAILNFILNYVPIVTFWIFTYHKIWILLIIFCFIWNYWIIYFLTCLEVFWSVVS